MSGSIREKPFLQKLYKGTGAKYLVRALKLRPKASEGGSFTPLRDAMAQVAGRSPGATHTTHYTGQSPLLLNPQPATRFSPLRQGMNTPTRAQAAVTPPAMPQGLPAANARLRAPGPGANPGPPSPMHRLAGYRPENSPLAQGLRQQPQNSPRAQRQAAAPAVRRPAAMAAQQATGVRRGSPTDEIIGRLAQVQPIFFTPAQYEPGAIMGSGGDLRLRHAKNAAAQGGYGRFYRGITVSGELRGIKQVNTARYAEMGPRGLSPTSPEMLQDEVAHMRRLGMNVHAIHETAKKMAFIETDLYAGDLRQAFLQIPALHRSSAARSALAQQAEQLASFHAAGYMHRDVKSENTLFSEKGMVQVADPGLATKLDDNVKHGATGTVAYMAPEVLDAWNVPKHYDQKCDTWSLGVVACECLVKEAWPLHGKDLYPKLQLVEALDAYRASVMRHGEVDLHAVAQNRGQGVWNHYFYQMSLADKGMCKFVLGRMLDANPKTRATMHEVIGAANDVSSVTRITAPLQRVRAFQLAAQANSTYQREVSALRAQAHEDRRHGLDAPMQFPTPF